MTDKPDLIRLDNSDSERAIALAMADGTDLCDRMIIAAERFRIQLALSGYFIGSRPVIPARHEAQPETPPVPGEVAAVARALMLRTAAKRAPETLGGLTPEYVADHGWPRLASIADCAIRALDKVRAENS